MDPELKAHQEWLGYLQPVGLVVAPAAMQDAGWVVTRSGSELIERQARYRAALEPLDDTADPDDSDAEQGFPSLRFTFRVIDSFPLPYVRRQLPL